MTADSKLIVASNRGPISWERNEDDTWTPRRGAGGLVVALGEALQQRPGTWVSVALEEGDREMAAEHDGQPFEADTGQGRFTLRIVDVGPAYDAYYNGMANRLLWFTLHQLWGEPYLPIGTGWQRPFDDYMAVNRQVAHAVIEEAREAGGDVEIHLQDYHLLAVAPLIRTALPDARIVHYIHTPWVHPTYFRRLPDPIVAAVTDGLTACDLVAVSAPEWRESLRACMEHFAHCSVRDRTPEGIWMRTPRGQTLLADFVLGIDADSLDAVATSDDGVAEGAKLSNEIGDRLLLVRADRTDLSKNILRGLMAFDLLLQRRPDLADRVHFRVLLDISRQGVEEYRDYLNRCETLAEEIRARHGDAVLALDTSKNFPAVVAALQRYDVLLTNPTMDGTNLVAKEGPALNTNDGVLVLSRNAGAANTMTDALMINPFDVDQTTDALEEAIDMPAAERARRAASLKRAASEGTPAAWLAAQHAALDAAIARR